MIDLERGYTERSFESKLKDAHQFLARARFEEAIRSYKDAREAALALKLTSRLNELDRLIRRARDQAECYERLLQERSSATQQTDIAGRLEVLVALTRLKGRCAAMEYRRLPEMKEPSLEEMAEEARRSIISSLSTEILLPLAEAAKGGGEYELVLTLLGGIQTVEDTPMHTLREKIIRIWEDEIEHRLSEADSFLTQSRPLDGLGSLQDLRRELSDCQAWRELWFALCRKQGVGLVDRGRQDLGSQRYDRALASFEKAYRAFDQGREAYPKTSSAEMLLFEASDLVTIARHMREAHTLLEAQQESKAFQMFSAIRAQLASFARQQRDYSLIKYGVDLRLDRLEEKLGSEATARLVLDQAAEALEANDRENAAFYLEQFAKYPDQLQRDFAAEYEQIQKQTASKEHSTQPDGPQIGERPPSSDEQKIATESPLSTEKSLASEREHALEPSFVSDRFMQWLVQVEPILAQARAAFLRGDSQTASESFQTLARNLDRETRDTDTPSDKD